MIMAWYAAAGEECPWNATLGREGGGFVEKVERYGQDEMQL